ncbi:DUF2182 domain-containing protein [Bradyrhizobium sp. WSM 1738]|nr:DUF2182 domain-containing protein [Bradyrhizobium hereditatis]
MGENLSIGIDRPLAFLRGGVLVSDVARFAMLPAASAWAIILALPFFVGPIDVCTARPIGEDLVSRYLVPQLLWILMVTAMMVPLAAPQIKILAARSPTVRRSRSVSLFLFGFLLRWICVGVGIAAAADLIGWPQSSNRMSVSVLYLAAATWQLTEFKKRALNRCHHVAPARALGRAADRDAMCNGWLHGRYCVSSCLLTMLPVSTSKLGPVAMAAVFALLLAERADHRPKLGLSAFVLFLLWINEMA